MTGFTTLTATVDGRIGRLTLDQPERLNPLGSTALRELAQAAAWFDASPATVVVVTGAGRAFSSGFDLREFADGSGDPARSAELGATMAEAVEEMRPVTIAGVHGHCVGGGVVLAAACDLIVAADDATFSIPEVDLGIPLAWGGIPRLVRTIGPTRTRELVMTCRPFDADEAQRIGLVNRVVAAAELDDAVAALAGQLADKAGSVLHATKQQVRQATGAAGDEPTHSDAELLAQALADPGARAAAQRYLEHRGG